MTVRYTPAAMQDLLELKGYISGVLQNPKAAARITGSILDACGQLRDFPRSGASLDARLGTTTGLRYLVCEKHIAFYRIEDEYISVARILDGRQDYLRILFGEMEQKAE